MVAASRTALLCRSVKYTCDAKRESYIKFAAVASLDMHILFWPTYTDTKLHSGQKASVGDARNKKRLLQLRNGPIFLGLEQIRGRGPVVGCTKNITDYNKVTGT